MQIAKTAYHMGASLLRFPLQIGFPGRWKVIGAYVNEPALEHYWAQSPMRWVKSVVHGHDMPCDMTIFSGRSAFFMRRWYEADTQVVILSLLEPGDDFVDIGANVGMASLTAAAAIGPTGRIFAFEPNPAVADIFAEAMRRNRLDNVRLTRAAFGKDPGEAEMFVPASNHGEGSLGTNFGDREGRRLTIPIVNADSLSGLRRCTLIKIDVEGFEVSVLEGLVPVIKKFRPAIITEVEEQHLQRCGASVEALAETLGHVDYQGYRYREKAAGAFQLTAELRPFDLARDRRGANVLWLPEEKAEQILSRPLKRIRR